MLWAVEALGKNAPLVAQEAALVALQDEDEEVRFSARRALTYLDVDPAMIPMEPLLRELQDQAYEHTSYWTELGLLARFGSRVPVEALLPLFGNSDAHLCGTCSRDALSNTSRSFPGSCPTGRGNFTRRANDWRI